MNLELINHIAVKFLKIDKFEEKPQTQKMYEKRKEYLKCKLNYLLKNYRQSHNKKYLWGIKQVKFSLNTNVSPKEYEILKQDIELLKRRYIEEIPEKYWQTTYFRSIFCFINSESNASIQDALKNIDEVYGIYLK